MSQTRQKALFQEGSVPPGGACLSSFVILTTGNDVLVGKMAKPEIWIERFFVGPKWAASYEQSGKYLLPASHLAWYESPIEAAERIVREQTELDIPNGSLKLLEVQSHLSGEIGDAEPPHWDLCFVYEARLPKSNAKKLKSLEWYKDLGFVNRSKLRSDDFARGHGEVLEQARAIGKKSKKSVSKKKRSS